MKTKLLAIFILFVFVMACESKSNLNGWYFSAIHLNQIWKMNKGKGDSQTIAIIDTGISKQAARLYKNRIVSKYNAINGTNDVTDEHGHGSQMISIACGDGKGGVQGIAPKAKIIVVKAIGATGNVKSDSIVNALRFAISKNVDIINMSFGSYIPSVEIEQLISVATEKGISVVASAGDYRNKDILFPASLKNVISVAAKDKKGNIWDKSNISKDVVIAFPGVGIQSFDLIDKPKTITTSDGTSQATAIASGFLALLRDYYVDNNIYFNNAIILKKMRQINAVNSKQPNYLLPFTD